MRRARLHISAVDAAVKAYQATGPWRVHPEPTDRVDVVAFRLRITEAVPADLITQVGDAVHNMRSALDAVAYEMARLHVGRLLTDTEERATQFPITRDADDFEGFFNNSARRSVFGSGEKRALRCVQPFALDEESLAHGVAPGMSPDLALVTDHLYRLHTISIIDKHRRLPIVAWFPDLVSWVDPPGGGSFRWDAATGPGDAFEDGTVLGHLTSLDGTSPSRADVLHDMRLALLDDPAYRQGLAEVLLLWHMHISDWVLPRIISVLSGHEPPLLIGLGTPVES